MIVGQTYTDLVEIRDADGVLGSATVTGTVTLPDGSTAAPTIGNPQVGIYPIDFLTTQVGRYEMVITATGGVLGTIVRKLYRAFFAESAAQGWLVSLGEAKDFLNIPADRFTHDEELSRFITVASDFVEARTGTSFVGGTATETVNVYRPENVIILSKGPAIAVTSVTEGGVTVPVGQYELNLRGNYLLRTSSGWGNPVVVTYTYGAGATTESLTRVRHAVLVVLKHLWSTQRGTLPMGGRQGGEEIYDPRSGYSFPRAVAEMLQDLGGSMNVYLG